MKKPRLLIAESRGFPATPLRALAGVFHVETADLTASELALALPGTNVLWVRLRSKIDRDLLASSPELAAIVTPTTGLNHLDVDEANRRGIKVLSLRGETEFLRDVRATAEHTIGLLLASLRDLPYAVMHVREGGWNRDLFQGTEIHRRSVGIVGYGRLGTLVASYLLALGADVQVCDPRLREEDVPPPIRLTSLNALLETSDIVSLHVDLRPGNVGMIGRAQFNMMRRGAVFLNTSRGELVDEEALLEALESGHISRAALDVLSAESSVGMGANPLVRYSTKSGRLIITPHVGGNTIESLSRTEAFMATKLLSWYAGGIESAGWGRATADSQTANGA